MALGSFGAAVARLAGNGGLGVGLVLVAGPSVMLFAGARQIHAIPLVGLPLLAIFGIMILFGSVALVALLFQSLGLTNASQPLGLPEGSIRAVIALALVVLFAIIAIMLFRTTAEPLRIDGLTATQLAELASGKSGERLLGSMELGCARRPPNAAASAPAPCDEADRRYAVMLRAGVPTETTDLAKQLLMLVGTLMTSITSYYFAARSVQAAAATQAAPPPTAAAAAAAPQAEDHVDGCDVAITQPTADSELPAAYGGVAPGSNPTLGG
ncbi:MAG: hypothetical protein GXC94_16490 [Comamonadaceae bacterium]|nr:hypothetical protein [Comamonadaceae bacterium]